MLVQKIQASINSLGTVINLQEVTGAYSVSNPAGYGAPNPATSAFDFVRILIQHFDAEKPSAVEDTLGNFLTNGLTLASSTGFDAGSFSCKAYFKETSGITVAPSGYSNKIPLTNANVVLAGIKYLFLGNASKTLVEIESLSSTEITLTEYVALSGVVTIYKAYEAVDYVFNTVPVDKCLVKRIGRESLDLSKGCHCSDELYHDLVIVKQAKFLADNDNFVSAHVLIHRVAISCSSKCSE